MIRKNNLRRREAVPKCLGIYIEDDVIKYAKVDKNKDVLKVDASSVIFYEKENLFQTIERIIRETFSSRDPIAINISNELYNYFEVFSALKPADKKKSIDLDFELLCGEKGYNKDSLDSRFLLRDSRENADKLKAIHISTNKENLRKRLQDFSGFKVVSASSISTSITNLVDLPPREDNVVIVNIEKDTKVTTIIGGEVYNINVIPEGMGEILNNINAVENSMQKSYECCRNTTIYTQDSQELQTTVDDNEHLEDVMPTLYKIVNEVRKIVDSTIVQISKVYITGLGTAINNVDLYFQEYISNVKCELLKPFFMENSSIKIPIKEYIEVNSAIALALDGLGYGNRDLNFKGKAGGDLSIDFSEASMEQYFKGFTDWRTPLNAFDKMMVRLLAGVCVGIVGYVAISNSIVNQIEEKQTEITEATQTVNTQISSISAQTAKINSAKTTYETLVSALTSKDDGSDKTTSTDTSSIVKIEKDAIPNLLNRIVYVIPKQVKITSIKNTQDTHIVIEAQAEKYEQLGYFKAALTTTGYLQNVKSTSGSKSDGVVKITIEGDLPWKEF